MDDNTLIKQETSNEYGISQELLALSYLSQYGIVSIPYGNSARYDCILDINNEFYRIQIKSLNLIDEDTIVIPMQNSRCTASGETVSKIYTSDEVDFIAISYNGKIYLFNPDLANKTLTVRINKPHQYNQRWLEDYFIDKVLNIKINSWVSLKEKTREEKGCAEQKKYKCIDCGAPVWNPNSRCVSCARINQTMLSAKPAREILKDKIKTIPFTTIGKEYGVTDNSVRKWCKTYNLPFRKKDIEEIIKKGEWDLI